MKVVDRLKKDVRITSRSVQKAAPCAQEIGTVFNCWRANNFDTKACALAAAELVECMKSRKPSAKSKDKSVNMINYWMKKAGKGKQY